DVWIGGEDAVDVGVDFAAVGVERRGQRDRGEIRGAAAQGGDIAALVDTLEAGHHRDVVFVERARYAVAIERFDLRAAVIGIGGEPQLMGEKRYRRASQRA